MSAVIFQCATYISNTWLSCFRENSFFNILTFQCLRTGDFQKMLSSQFNIAESNITVEGLFLGLYRDTMYKLCVRNDHYYSFLDHSSYYIKTMLKSLTVEHGWAENCLIFLLISDIVKTVSRLTLEACRALFVGISFKWVKWVHMWKYDCTSIVAYTSTAYIGS